MIDPFVFYYWAQGFPPRNDLAHSGDNFKMTI